MRDDAPALGTAEREAAAAQIPNVPQRTGPPARGTAGRLEAHLPRLADHVAGLVENIMLSLGVRDLAERAPQGQALLVALEPRDYLPASMTVPHDLSPMPREAGQGYICFTDILFDNSMIPDKMIMGLQADQ